jgi:hypothetical protein
MLSPRRVLNPVPALTTDHVSHVALAGRGGRALLIGLEHHFVALTPHTSAQPQCLCSGYVEAISHQTECGAIGDVEVYPGESQYAWNADVNSELPELLGLPELPELLGHFLGLPFFGFGFSYSHSMDKVQVCFVCLLTQCPCGHLLSLTAISS